MDPGAGPRVGGTLGRIERIMNRYIEVNEKLYMSPSEWLEPDTLPKLRAWSTDRWTDPVAASTALYLACLYDKQGPGLLFHIEFVYEITKKMLVDFIYPQLKKLEAFVGDDRARVWDELYFSVCESFRGPGETIDEEGLDHDQLEFLVQAQQGLAEVVAGLRETVAAYVSKSELPPEQANLLKTVVVSEPMLQIWSFYDSAQSDEQEAPEQPEAEQSPRQATSSEGEEEPEVEDARGVAVAAELIPPQGISAEGEEESEVEEGTSSEEEEEPEVEDARGGAVAAELMPPQGISSEEGEESEVEDRAAAEAADGVMYKAVIYVTKAINTEKKEKKRKEDARAPCSASSGRSS